MGVTPYSGAHIEMLMMCRCAMLMSDNHIGGGANRMAPKQNHKHILRASLQPPTQLRLFLSRAPNANHHTVRHGAERSDCKV